MRPQHTCFIVKCTKFLRTYFLRSYWSDWFWILQLSSMSRYYNKDLKMTSVAAIFFSFESFHNTVLCWDRFGSHHPATISKSWICTSEKSVVENHCIAVQISFMNLVNSVGSMGSVGAWTCGWRESNFGRDRGWNIWFYELFLWLYEVLLF